MTSGEFSAAHRALVPHIVAICVMQTATQALGGHAEEAVYRVRPFAEQQVTVSRGVLRAEPPVRFVSVMLTPVSGARDARYEHRFPSRGAAATDPLRLTVRDVALYAEDAPLRQHPFEHTLTRIRVYWGCGEAVGPGQPLVIDVHPSDDERLSRLLALSPPRAATVAAGARETMHDRFLAHADEHWPERAEMRGTHELRNGSTSTTFVLDLAAGHMAPAAITHVSALPQEAVRIQWENLQRASAYFANVFVHRRLSREVVIWTSSTRPEGGWVLSGAHLATAELEQLRAAGVLLPPGTKQCAVPAAVRRHAHDGMVFQLHAYASEVTTRGRGSAPEQGTLVRVAAKSTTTLMLKDPETAIQASAAR